MKKLLVSLCLSLLSIGSAIAAPCDTIVTHGLRNISISKSSDALVANKYFNHCNTDYSFLSDQQVADLEVEVFGYGGGGAGWQRNKVEENLKSWCKTNKETAEENRSSVQETQTFYQGAVEAWKACIALHSKDVRINPRITPDNRTVDIGISYAGPSPSGVLFSGIKSEGFKCEITTPNADEEVTFPLALTTQSIQVHCKRNEALEREINGENFSYVPRGVISIQTVSDPFQLYFVEEWTPPLPIQAVEILTKRMVKKAIPVGTVISSAVPPAKFLSRENPQFEEGKWVEANGQALPSDSRYSKLTGSGFAPNLTFMNTQHHVVGVIQTTGKNGETLASKQPADLADANWTWFPSVNDITGQVPNRDFEQAEDQFQTTITGGTVLARGRTFNFKHGIWGNWRAGDANLLGIATRKSNLFYYVKIN